MRKPLHQLKMALVLCLVAVSWYFFSTSKPKNKTQPSRSPLHRELANVKKPEPKTQFSASHEQPVIVPNSKDTTISFEDLQKNITITNRLTQREGYEWAYTLGKSMGIEAHTVTEMQVEAEAKVNQGQLDPQDVEDYLRQRLDEYEWTHHEADISNDDPDWVAQN